MGNMKKLANLVCFFCLMLTLLGSAQPVSADSGVIGSPPAIPDPAIPSLQYSGCARQNVATFNSGFEQQVIDLVNQERTSRGPQPTEAVRGIDHCCSLPGCRHESG